ncbi:tyrosine-type recombinase/integrase (plasmid) [Deinococcus radiomollis]|uniref:tyrosine-type recombinase/integrase n=1 Tax=Deinococcus radiomollis TaxID=468916 RepID=UPI0038923532
MPGTDHLPWKTAGIEFANKVDRGYNAGYHALRYYAGTRLTREGASLDDVARHLGHSVLETARIYAKWSDEGLRRRVGGW